MGTQTAFAQCLDTYCAGFDRTILAFYHGMAERMGSIATPILWFISFLGDEGIWLIILGIILLCFKKTRKSGVQEYVDWWQFVGATVQKKA